MRCLTLVLLVACSGPSPFSVVSFNTGTTEGLPHDADMDDGYTSEQATVSDAHYGDGLAWPAAVEAAQLYFADAQPDLVGFQEMFWAGACPDIPAEHHEGWFCEDWSDGDPTVAQVVLGEGYQVACHPGKPDKCLAVHERFGAIDGCEEAFCLEGLQGAEVDGCGSGARVAWMDVVRPTGDPLRVVHIHGSSGLSDEDQACRTAQFEAAFAQVQTPTVLLGDLNTDPGRWTDLDESAGAFAELAEAAGLGFMTAVGANVEPSYGGVVNIDHVLADSHIGSCITAGIDEGSTPVLETTYFDHHPVRCELE
ncbi:MAG: hypothetical protein KC912_05630 [Proteobacteria bacterium]|nr:hypothetical protein [Pseudomonadota bacterium]